MDPREIEFVCINEVIMKPEDFGKDLFEEESKISSSSDCASAKKCGEIFTLDYNQLSFICAFCNRYYDKIFDFGKHLRDHGFKCLESLDFSRHATEGDNKFTWENMPTQESYDKTKANASSVAEISACTESDVSFGASINLEIENYSFPGRNTGKQGIVSPGKAFECTACKKHYRNARNLRRHNCPGSAASNQVVSDHVCMVCKRKYANKRNLRRHKCRGAAYFDETARDKTTNTNCNKSISEFVDTEVKDHYVLKSGNEANCVDFYVYDQLENIDYSIVDSDSKDENISEELCEQIPERKRYGTCSVLFNDEIEQVEYTDFDRNPGIPNHNKSLQLTECNICCDYILDGTVKEHRCPDKISKPNTLGTKQIINDVNKEGALLENIEFTTNKTDDDMTNPDLYCDICKKQFIFKHIFRRHGMMHSEPPSAMRNKPDYLKCQYCGVKVVKHADWFSHERTHSSRFRHECPHCSKVFKRGIVLKAHINTHTGERPYKCDQCPATFAHNANRSTHKRRIHLRSHPHACSYCPVKCMTPSELRQHMKSHTGDKAYQCEVCGKSFRTATKLNEHSIVHNNVRNVKCPLCPMAFVHRKRLEGHMVKHSTERPYTCDVCGDTFSRSHSLRLHKKLHLPKKQYECPICGKAFAQPAGLYAHKKTHNEVC